MLLTREIDNPYLTDGLYYGDDDARRQARAKITVTENALSRIGALCFIRRREKHHEHAAELFKSLYEARYGCGTPAMDASREPVDRSIVAHDSGMAAKIDRTWKLEQAERELGKPTFNRLVALLVLCIPAGEGAPTMPSGHKNRRWVQQSITNALDDLDRLCELWRLQSRAA